MNTFVCMAAKFIKFLSIAMKLLTQQLDCEIAITNNEITNQYICVIYSMRLRQNFERGMKLWRMRKKTPRKNNVDCHKKYLVWYQLHNG